MDDALLKAVLGRLGASPLPKSAEDLLLAGPYRVKTSQVTWSGADRSRFLKSQRTP